MLQGVVLLTMGSTGLLAWWVFSLPFSGTYAPIFLLPIFVFPAALVHLIAWGKLLRGAEGSPMLTTLFLASIVAFVAGLATLPLTVPRSWLSYAVCPFFPLFPYLPTVFGPVIVVHGLLFVAANWHVRERPAFLLVTAGAAFLVALASIGVFEQFEYLAHPYDAESWFFGLAGFTSLGYALIAAGFHRRFHDSTMTRFDDAEWNSSSPS